MCTRQLISSKGYLTSVEVADEKANYEDKIFSFLVRSVQEYSGLKVDSYFPSLQNEWITRARVKIATREEGGTGSQH